MKDTKSFLIHKLSVKLEILLPFILVLQTPRLLYEIQKVMNETNKAKKPLTVNHAPNSTFRPGHEFNQFTQIQSYIWYLSFICVKATSEFRLTSFARISKSVAGIKPDDGTRGCCIMAENYYVSPRNLCM